MATERVGSNSNVPANGEEVRAALQRVLSSPELRSERRRELLRYLAERVLAGKGDTLSEYGIALDVFGKPESFDPRTESTVRAEMSRLRTSLARYYENGGANDRLRIELPARGYALLFTRLKAQRRPARNGLRLHWGWWAATAFAAVAVLAWWWFRPDLPSARSVVVIPFANLTGDPGNDYIAEGLTAKLNDSLERVASLRVVAEASASHYKSNHVSLREIGRVVDADMAIEGSVRGAAGRLQVAFQMSRTSDGRHILSKTWDVQPADLGEVAQDLPALVLATLRPHEQVIRGRIPDREAWRLLLQARALRGYGTPDKFASTVALLRQAIQRDPRYAEPYAELANAYIAAATNGFVDPIPGAAHVRAAAAKAMELDPFCAEALAARGYSDAMIMLDWKGGEAALRRALQLTPQDAAMHQHLGLLLMAQGRFPEALAEARTAASLDPLTPAAGAAVGTVYFMQRHYDEALVAWRKLLALHPDALILHRFIGMALEARGDYAGATAEFKMVADRYPAVVADDALLLTALSGKLGEAQKGLEKMERTAPDHYFTFAVLDGYLGRRDEAFRWLDLTWQQRGLWLLKVYPFLDPLRGDPRFAALLRRTGFAERLKIGRG